MVEMAFRVYDPCNSCATHSLPGQMPIKAVIRNPDGSVYDTVTKNL
jgi:F420-non-reducing hydrogenase large subunit